MVYSVSSTAIGKAMGNQEAKFKREVEGLVADVLGSDEAKETEWSNKDDYADLDSLQAALRKKGMESCGLIVGIDFTASNRRQGKHSFHGESLHARDSVHGPNPYELALAIIGRAVTPFADGGGISAFVFGDTETRHHSVRSLGPEVECKDTTALIEAYREAIKDPALAGPTSFAPLIEKAIELVKARGNTFHILLIVADGQVDDVEGCLQSTYEAIRRACSVPLSIVVIGIGDGPWDEMERFDNGLPERPFDNFQFVEFQKFQALLGRARVGQHKVVEAAFAVCALQEVPPQFTAMRRNGLLGVGVKRPANQADTAEDDIVQGTKRPRTEPAGVADFAAQMATVAQPAIQSTSSSMPPLGASVAASPAAGLEPEASAKNLTSSLRGMGFSDADIALALASGCASTQQSVEWLLRRGR